jgi:hypothetical protein
VADTKGPSLLGIAVNPTELAQGPDGRKVTVSLLVFDDYAGASFCSLNWAFQSAMNVSSFATFKAFRTSSLARRPTNATISGEMSFPAIPATGVWMLTSVSCIDLLEKETFLTRAKFSESLLRNSIISQRFVDRKISVSRITLSSGVPTNGRAFIVQLSFECSLDTVKSCSVQFAQQADVYTVQFSSVALLSGNLTVGVLGTQFVMSPFAPPGTWSLRQVQCISEGGIQVTLWDSAELSAIGSSDAQFTLTQPGDEAPPELTDIRVSPSSFSSRSENVMVSVTLQVYDDFSGAKNCTVRFESSAHRNFQPLIIIALTSSRSTIASLKGTGYIRAVPGIGPFVLLSIVCVDNAGRIAEYQRNQLLQIASESTLTIVPDPNVIDDSPPRVIQFGLVGNHVRSSSSPSVGVWISFSDDLSGISTCTFVFTQLQQSVSFQLSRSYLVSGSVTSGNLSSSFVIDTDQYIGTFDLSSLACADRVGNEVVLQGSLLSSYADKSSSLTIVNTQEPSVAVLVSTVQITPNTINTTTASSIVSFTIRGQSERSIVFCVLRLRSPNDLIFTLNASNVTNSKKLFTASARYIAERYSEPGLHLVESLFCEDDRGSKTNTLTGLDPVLRDANGVLGFTNVGVDDNAAPIFTGLEVASPQVNTSMGDAVLRVQVNVSDSLSGIKYCTAAFYPPLNNTQAALPVVIVINQTVATAPVSGSNVLTVTLAGEQSLPMFSFFGFYTLSSISCFDRSGNALNIDGSSLLAYNLTNTGFNQVGSVQDESPPALSSCSVNPSVVNTSLASVDIVLECEFIDDKSGLDFCDFTFERLLDDLSPNYLPVTVRTSAENIIAGSTLQGTLHVSFPIAHRAPLGSWIISRAYCQDRVSRFVENTFPNGALVGAFVDQVGLPIVVSMEPARPSASSDSVVGIVIGIIIAVIVLVALVVLFLVWRRRQQGGKRHHSNVDASLTKSELVFTQLNLQDGNENLAILRQKPEAPLTGPYETVLTRFQPQEPDYESINYEAMTSRPVSTDAFGATLKLVHDEDDLMMAAAAREEREGHIFVDSKNDYEPPEQFNNPSKDALVVGSKSNYPKFDLLSSQTMAAHTEFGAPPQSQQSLYSPPLPEYSHLHPESGATAPAGTLRYHHLEKEHPEETDLVVGLLMNHAQSHQYEAMQGEDEVTYQTPIVNVQASHPYDAPTVASAPILAQPSHGYEVPIPFDERHYLPASGQSTRTPGTPRGTQTPGSPQSHDYEYAPLNIDPSQVLAQQIEFQEQVYDALLDTRPVEYLETNDVPQEEYCDPGAIRFPTATSSNAIAVQDQDGTYDKFLSVAPHVGLGYGWNSPAKLELVRQSWFYDGMTREQADALLSSQGWSRSFLVEFGLL